MGIDHSSYGGTATLRPALSDAARKAITRALHAGRRITVNLTITVEDAAGNARNVTWQVRLRL
jgi:hypothetical protein